MRSNLNDRLTIVLKKGQIPVTVVIPLYRTALSEIERWALERNLSLLKPERDIAVVCPEGLDLSPLESVLGIAAGRCRVERFNPQFFAGRVGYNRLMLSTELYTRFARSRYVLILQTDVVLFADELDRWCAAGYDYIGAPWLPARGEVEGWNVLARASYALRRRLSRLRGGFSPMQLKWKVGNGGFSLRRVEAMLDVATRHRAEIDDLDHNRVENFEDVVLSVRAAEQWHEPLRVPDAATAAQFAIESHPAMAMRINGGRLPMGAHAFYRRRNRAFWQKRLPELTL